MKVISKLYLPIACGALLFGASSALGQPVAGQITPVAVYHSTPGAFGLAFDSTNNLIWYTQGDSGGDNRIHSLKAFNSYTPAELAGLTQTGGVYDISLAQGNHDAAGTTAVTGPGGSGSGAHFSGLAFDSSTGKLVYDSSASLRAVDPFGGNDVALPGTPGGFRDGLDIDGGVIWDSPDVGSIFKDGVLFANGATATAALAGTGVTVNGFSGVEQVGSALFAVGVGNFGGHSRSILKFDANTGALLGYDPDGDAAAVRWEDLAFDGRYLYAADLRGNRDGTGARGDIYVFDTGGGIIIDPPSGVPDGGSTLLMLLGAIGLTSAARLRARRNR